MEKELKSEEEWNEKPKALKGIALVLRIGFVVGLLLAIGWFLLRGHYQKGTSAMKEYLFTEEAAELYEQGTLEIKRLGEYNDSALGRAFYIGNIYYTEVLGQFQFMIRYNRNNGLVSSLIDEHGLHCFTFALVDDKGNIYTEYQYQTDSKMMYGYYRLIFSDVDVTEALQLKVYVFYDDGKEKQQSQALNSCVVWYTEGVKSDYDLTRSEKKSEKPTSGLAIGSITPSTDFFDEEEEN